MLTLHDYLPSLNGWKVRVLLGHLRIPYRTKPVAVGNCCVKNFFGLPSERIFQGVKRVRANDEKALNEPAVVHAHKSGWINDWERDFCLDTMRKRVLSPKQLAKWVEINRRVLQRMKRGTTPSLV